MNKESAFIRNQILQATIASNYQPQKALSLMRAGICEDSKEVVAANPSFLTILEGKYPPKLKALALPPLCLFYQGNLELLDYPSVGIIGSRENDEYGRQVVEALVQTLPSHVAIVSGLAKGIDGLAHRYALERGKCTIGIIGSGFKYQYPLCNQAIYERMAKEQLILSEYAYEEKIRKNHFIARNRLIAAMSDVLVVVESTLHSGTLITVNEMLNLGKEVYVVPHPLFSPLGEGNLKLLFEGANLLYSIEEFCEKFKNV